VAFAASAMPMPLTPTMMTNFTRRESPWRTAEFTILSPSLPMAPFAAPPDEI